MRRAPICLLFTAFMLSFGISGPDGALAGPGFGHGPASSHSAWGGHSGFKRGHWTRPRHGFAARWRFPRHPHQFFAGHGHPNHGYGRHGYRHHAYRPYFYGYPGYSHFYGSRGYGSGFHGYRGYGSHYSYSYGRHGYRQPFYGVHGYGYRGYRSFPYWTGSHFGGLGGVTIPIAVKADAPPGPPAIPSLADLPVAKGIQSAPVASSAIYVLSSDRGSARSRSGDAVNTDAAESENVANGPRIIRLDVPRGR